MTEASNMKNVHMFTSVKNVSLKKAICYVQFVKKQVKNTKRLILKIIQEWDNEKNKWHLKYNEIMDLII